jgi:outer membrane protein OmpA-like peptidoglycan-associated protein
MNRIFIVFLLLSGLSLKQYAQDTASVSITRFEGLPSNIKVFKTYIDAKNLIWLSTSNGLYEISADGSKNIHYLKGTQIFDYVQDRNGQGYAASKNRITQVSTNKSFELPVPGVQIKDIDYFAGEIWAGTDQGLFQIAPVTGKISHFTVKNSKLPSNQINFVHADKNKVVWLGTNSGYVRIVNDKWDVEDKNIKMLATSENEEGQWIISEKDMFLISKFNRLFPVQLEENQYKGTINDFVLDSKGRIYIASDILVRYDPYQEKIEQFTSDAAMLSKATTSLACDKNDNIWIGTGGAGFYKLLFGDIALEQLNASILLEKPVSCPGAADAVVKVATSGGHKPYQYTWSVADITTGTAQNLKAGEYMVTVTDKYNTSAIASILIEEPLPLQIAITDRQRVSGAQAQDGSADIEISGGTGDIQIRWSNGQMGKNLKKVSSGTYQVTATDANGCNETASVTIDKEKFIPDLEISRVTVGQTLRINELNFEADSSRITASNYEVLQEVFDFLSKNPQVNVEIGGHTNTIPPHEYCDKLSTERAKNVAEFLYSKGIAQARVSYKGYGKRQPLTPSESLQGRLRNQRVEIKILAL